MTNAQTTNGPTIDAAFEQVKDLNEQVVGAARKVGNLYVDTYETAVERTVELELKVAGLSQQEWLKNLIEAQIDFSREIANASATTARSLLK
jgi:hypothetical protein